MNTRDAAYLTGHHYPGGEPALAARTATLQPQAQPVARYSLAFPPAGNSNRDYSLGCNFKN